MDVGVVVAAEKHEVREVGGPAVDPMLDVVGVAPSCRLIAAAPLAAAIAEVEGPALGGRYGASASADVEWLLARVRDDA